MTVLNSNGKRAPYQERGDRFENISTSAAQSIVIKSFKDAAKRTDHEGERKLFENVAAALLKIKGDKNGSI